MSSEKFTIPNKLLTFLETKKILEIRLEELIRGCCKNKKSAQSKVYQLYADQLFGICLKYSRNSPDAEDILQDSFLIIFNKIIVHILV